MMIGHNFIVLMLEEPIKYDYYPQLFRYLFAY